MSARYWLGNRLGPPRRAIRSWRWPDAGYAGFGGGDHSTAYRERAEIYDLVRDAGIACFATVAGEPHDGVDLRRRRFA